MPQVIRAWIHASDVTFSGYVVEFEVLRADGSVGVHNSFTTWPAFIKWLQRVAFDGQLLIQR